MQMHDDRHVVVKDGKVASQGWRGAPGSGFIWTHNTTRDDWMLIFPTPHGARLFANMNGGKPISLVEHMTRVAA